jgi:hypothetical protein
MKAWGGFSVSFGLHSTQFKYSIFFIYSKFKKYFINFHKEPVGSVSPKVNAGADLNSVKTEIDKSTSLLCLSQGFPPPVYRLVRIRQILFTYSIEKIVDGFIRIWGQNWHRRFIKWRMKI